MYVYMYKYVYNFPAKKNIEIFQFSLDKNWKRNIINMYLIIVCFLHSFLDLFSRFVSSVCRQSRVAGAIPAGRFLSGTKTAYRLFECWIIFSTAEKQNNICMD